MAEPPTSEPPGRPIALIASCMALGSGQKSAEGAPLLLLGAGLADRVGAKKVTVVEPSTPFGADTESHEVVIMEHAGRVSDAVSAAVNDGFFPVVIGGDHTSAIGFYAGLSRARGETGVVWIDTHPDLNTPETSPSGNIHGMVLAGLLGRGSPAMHEFSKATAISESNVAMVGIRSIDAGEQRWLDEGTIHCMTMGEVRSRGLEACIHDAVQTANQAAAGFGMTIDIDVIDPSQAPFVATAVDGGLDVTELASSLHTIPHTDRLLGMEVTEFTPRNDDDAAAACTLVTSLVSAMQLSC